ncbi:MAG: hypothetical protein IPG89_18300 [Bacteroidetes bacterium]|nr:hypothetical protein [Bacteroidota bacterium]
MKQIDEETVEKQVIFREYLFIEDHVNLMKENIKAVLILKTKSTQFIRNKGVQKISNNFKGGNMTTKEWLLQLKKDGLLAYGQKNGKSIYILKHLAKFI